MPQEYQKSVSIPKWVWDLAEKYYEKNEDELKMIGVNSTTGLITYWIREELKDST